MAALIVKCPSRTAPALVRVLNHGVPELVYEARLFLAIQHR